MTLGGVHVDNRRWVRQFVRSRVEGGCHSSHVMENTIFRLWSKSE